MVAISPLTAKDDLGELRIALGEGLEAGLTNNPIKEALVYTYAHCGFSSSIRGLQTFMEVLDERKVRGIDDKIGSDASPIELGCGGYLFAIQVQISKQLLSVWKYGKMYLAYLHSVTKKMFFQLQNEVL